MRGIVKKVSAGTLFSTRLLIFSVFRAGVHVSLSLTFIILAIEVK